MSKQLSPLKMTADECRQRLAAEKRSRHCLPQDIEYWQFYIDFHTHGQAYAESRQRGSAPDHPHSLPAAPAAADTAGASLLPAPAGQSVVAA